MIQTIVVLFYLTPIFEIVIVLCQEPIREKIICSCLCTVFRVHEIHVFGEKDQKTQMTRENRSSGFPTRSDTNRPVQSQKQARSLTFRKRNCTVRVAKTKALISFAVTAKLICGFCFCAGKNPVFDSNGILTPNETNGCYSWVLVLNIVLNCYVHGARQQASSLPRANK